MAVLHNSADVLATITLDLDGAVGVGLSRVAGLNILDVARTTWTRARACYARSTYSEAKALHGRQITARQFWISGPPPAIDTRPRRGW